MEEDRFGKKCYFSSIFSLKLGALTWDLQVDGTPSVIAELAWLALEKELTERWRTKDGSHCTQMLLLNTY